MTIACSNQPVTERYHYTPGKHNTTQHDNYDGCLLSDMEILQISTDKRDEQDVIEDEIVSIG